MIVSIDGPVKRVWIRKEHDDIWTYISSIDEFLKLKYLILIKWFFVLFIFIKQILEFELIYIKFSLQMSTPNHHDLGIAVNQSHLLFTIILNYYVQLFPYEERIWSNFQNKEVIFGRSAIKQTFDLLMQVSMFSQAIFIQ